MKAKEYAERYLSDPSIDEVVRVMRDMLIESKSLIEQRNVKTDAALYSVLDETDKKWRAFVRLINNNGINPDGLMEYIKCEMPYAFYPWMDYRQVLNRRN